jgi:hypothetical protein
MQSDVKVFFLKLILVAGILVLVDFTAGVGLKTFFYKQKSGKYYKITHAIKYSREDILIFGNSHAAEHFDARLMQQLTSEKVFNFGSGGQSFFYTYPVVKSILNRHSPKLIIVNMDYDDLAFQPKAYELLSIFLPYYGVNAVIDSAISLMPFNETFKCHSSLYRYNSTLGNTILNTYVKKYTQNVKYLGYEAKIGNFCKTVGTRKKTEQLQDLKFDQNKINYLLRLIDATKSRNIKLLITTTPLYNYNADKFKIFKQKLQQILIKYNVPYLDYGTNSGFSGKCEYFNDNSHLNPTGASKWTRQCSQYIKTEVLSNTL